MKLTKRQLQATDHKDGNLQLIACAGSGKTEVVARRVVTLLRSGLKPANIIAFTYTDKAVAELKERLVTHYLEEIGNVTGMLEMYIGTIHAFCLDLLRTEVSKFLKLEVLNEVQQPLFIDRHSARSGLTTSTDLAGRRLDC
jgi:DNA helicase-2/ATP-dependent DNA helicase PcrA